MSSMPGKTNPSYIDGRTLKKYYCSCGNLLSYDSIRKGTKQCMRCYIKTLKGKTHPRYGKKHTKKAKILMQKNHANIFGNKNPNWRGGLSFEPYSYKFCQKLKHIILNRDNNKCFLCNITNKKHIKKYKDSLSCHHIDYNKMNCKEHNLITLCYSCHSKTNYNRDYWYAYFRYIMENLNIQ